jgi:hypothetical protein
VRWQPVGRFAAVGFSIAYGTQAGEPAAFFGFGAFLRPSGTLAEQQS